MARKWGRISWYKYHRANAESAALQRAQRAADFHTGAPRQKLKLAALERQLAEALSRQPLLSKIAWFFGLASQYYQHIILPLERQIQEASDVLRQFEQHESAILNKAKDSWFQDFCDARSERKAEQERRREAARIRYLERAPNLRSAQRRLRVVLIDRAMNSDGVVQCYYCQLYVAPAAAHIDHKQPISRRGTNRRDNLVLACAPCNLSKGSKTEAEFRRQ